MNSVAEDEGNGVVSKLTLEIVAKVVVPVTATDPLLLMSTITTGISL
jgi:hypothetical protein